MEYDRKLDILYTIAVLRYKGKNPNLAMDQLFPIGWHSSKNYKLKIEILAEAIDNNKLVEDTNLYKENFSGDFKQFKK